MKLTIVAKSQCWNCTRMAVMLSVPIPSEEATFVAIIFSNMSPTMEDIFSVGFLSLSLSFMSWAVSWELRQSQIPSQANTMNLVSGASLCMRTSGTHVIIYSSTLSFLFCLYSRSPMARERARTPLTLFSSTKPPAFSILAFSPMFCGL